MGKEFYLPNGTRANVKSISFFDSGNIQHIVLTQDSKLFITLPNTKMVKPTELGYDEEGNINFVKLNKDEIVILNLPGKDKRKIRTTEIGFDKKGNFTHFKLPYGDKIDIELPNKTHVKVHEITYYNTGEIKNAILSNGEYIFINNEKILIKRISFYITGQIKKISFILGESINLYENIVFPKEIEYYENGEIKSLLLKYNESLSLAIPKTKEKVKIYSISFYSSTDIQEIKLLQGETITLPNGRKAGVSNILFDEYGNIIEVKMYDGEIRDFKNNGNHTNKNMQEKGCIIHYNREKLYLNNDNN